MKKTGDYLSREFDTKSRFQVIFHFHAIRSRAIQNLRNEHISEES
jgi:hypothetical protein